MTTIILIGAIVVLAVIGFFLSQPQRITSATAAIDVARDYWLTYIEPGDYAARITFGAEPWGDDWWVDMGTDDRQHAVVVSATGAVREI